MSKGWNDMTGTAYTKNEKSALKTLPFNLLP